MTRPRCPLCGGDALDRVEVDIGVGVQCGPWRCYDCLYSEDCPADEECIVTFVHCWGVWSDRMNALPPRSV